MALKYQVENLEGINEAAQAFYKEQDGGGYVLQVEGVVGADKFNEVNQRAIDASTEAKRRRGTVERVLGKLGLENADGLDDALDALKAGGKGKSSEEQEAIIAQIKSDAQKKLDEANKKYTGVLMQGAIAETKAALQEAGFPAKVAEMLAKTSTDRLKLDDGDKVRIMGDNGNPLAGSGGDGYATYGDLAKELAAAMPELLADKGKGGGGKPPASKSNTSGATVTVQALEAMTPQQKAAFFKENPGVVVQS
jgi:hypothetical protein